MSTKFLLGMRCRFSVVCCRGINATRNMVWVNATWEVARMLHRHRAVRVFVDQVGGEYHRPDSPPLLSCGNSISCILYSDLFVRGLTLAVMYKYELWLLLHYPHKTSIQPTNRGEGQPGEPQYAAASGRRMASEPKPLTQ